MSIKLPILIIFTILLIDSIGLTKAYQYYCYSCTNCNDPLQTTKATLVLCNNGCYKNVNNIPGQSTVERGCSTLSGGCSNQIYGALGYGVYNYCCWGNYCNSSNRIKISVFSYSILFTMVLISRNIF